MFILKFFVFPVVSGRLFVFLENLWADPDMAMPKDPIAKAWPWPLVIG